MDGVANIAKEYYKNLFTSSNHLDMERVIESVDHVVTEEMAQALVRPYTEEVRTAFFQMLPSKSPGPNVMSPFFFQKFWHIVGNDVIATVLSFLQSGRYLRKMNFTNIVLIPKKNVPKYIMEFRPISVGNIVSRIISKVLANRIKVILPNVISDSQSAFMLDRNIIDNTTVAFEMLHRIRNKRKRKTGHMAVKLDISKAYDRVEWEFLRRIMLKIGLPNQWDQLAMEMVCTASYSILLNGEPTGFITPSRGIKQRDPLSPYLFLMCAEGLSSLIQKAIDNQHMKGMVSC